MPASMLLPPVRMKIPPSATISASARTNDSRSPRTGHASSATQTGTEIASTDWNSKYKHGWHRKSTATGKSMQRKQPMHPTVQTAVPDSLQILFS
jgi:hypothetical protein